MGALPTLFAATQDIPGDSFVGPDGFMEQRGHPKLVGRTPRRAATRTSPAACGTLSERLTGVSSGVAAAADAPPV